MLLKMRNLLARPSLARQFMLASFAILVAGMLIIGGWISLQIERGVINQTAGVTALYVDSFIAPHLQDLARGVELDATHLQALDQLMFTTPLGKRIVAFKVWSPDGKILYSTTPSLIGQKFTVGYGLQRALSGQVASHISDLQESENVEEQRRWPRLFETYAPVRLAGTEQVVAVSEFYQTVDDLSREVTTAQLTSWLIVGVCTLIMYLLLAGMVRRGSNTIAQQQTELEQKFSEIAQLNERVRRAAARTTALNERFLRRISADLHDGPGQDISFALLRFYAIVERCTQCPVADEQGRPLSADFNAIQISLQSGLRELRAISAGLRLPELDALSLRETVARAVREHEDKTGRRVDFTSNGIPEYASSPVKITLYRLAQEALANGHRHAQDAKQYVRIWTEGKEICLEVVDNGPGFNMESLVQHHSSLGLAGMRERVQVLGGIFLLESAPGRGTRIRARLPEEVSDE